MTLIVYSNYPLSNQFNFALIFVVTDKKDVVKLLYGILKIEYFGLEYSHLRISISHNLWQNTNME